jgi:hypothetical protein
MWHTCGMQSDPHEQAKQLESILQELNADESFKDADLSPARESSEESKGLSSKQLRRREQNRAA